MTDKKTYKVDVINGTVELIYPGVGRIKTWKDFVARVEQLMKEDGITEDAILTSVIWDPEYSHLNDLYINKMDDGTISISED